MRSYNSSPSPLGEGGIHMPFQTQHHHHHHHHHHYHHQQPQQQQQFQAAQRHINNNNVNHHYLQHQPQPQQIQQQQQANHHHYYSQTQYQAMRAPNGAPTTAIKQTAIYPPQDLGPQAPYYNYTQHYHHQQQHHLAQQQWRAQNVVYGNAAAAAGRGGGYPQYSPSFLNVEYPAPQQTFYRDSHHGGDGRGLTNTHGGFNANSEKDSRESYFAVHLKSFAELEEVKRRNSIRESLDQAVYAKMKRRPYAGILKIFLIVERHYLAACMSIPQSEDDVILSKEVAMEFLDVAHVYCDDGDRLVELEDGAHVAKHVYSTLRCALRQLAVYEESKLNNADFEVDFFDSASFSAEKLLTKDIVANHAVSTSLFHALEKDDDAADALWRRLLLEPSTASSTNTTSSNTTAAAATSTDGIDSVAQPQQQQQNVSASSGKGNGSLLLLSSSKVGILSTVQGIRLFRKAVRHPKRRETLFHVLKEAAAPPPPPPPSEENSESQPLLPFMPEQLFLTLFSSSLTSWFVFECFGLVEGSFRCEEEVNVICAALERLALKVVCNNGGSFLMTALVKALCPSQFLDGEKVGGKRSRSSESRGRQEEKREEQQVEAGNDESYSHNNNNGNKNENNGNSNRDMAKSGGGGADEEAPLGTTTMSDLRISEMTSDWRLFYAVARAFVAGPIPGKASSGEAMLTCRVKLLTQHVVACRAIQRFIPFFAATVIQGQKNMKQKEKREEREGEQEANKQIPSPEREQFYDDCGKILTEIANQSGLLASHSYGNYVLQTVISELAECAIPGSLIEEMLRKVFDTLTETIFHVCVQKFASNCVETAIKACHKLPNANSLILRFATALLSQGPDRMLQVAMQQFGNYAVRRILLSLTDIATADSQTATAAEVEEARALERQYFSYLNYKLEQLRQTAYGTGVLAWVQNQRERLQAAE